MPLLCRMSNGALSGGNPMRDFVSLFFTAADNMSLAWAFRLSVPEKRLLLSKQM